MTRTMLALAAILFAAPALAQAPAQPAPAPATPAPAPAPAATPKDVPMSRLMSDGAQVRGADSKDRIVLQLGKYVFLCRHESGKPSLCDLVP